MSRQTLPQNQQRHDNVAVVKLKAGRCKFEIACYRNKAQSYRKGVEKDVEEVLQIERVFTNVTQGKFARVEDVRKYLGPLIPKSKAMNDDELERAACRHILDTGTMQLNEMERQAEVEHMLNDVATFISEKTLHPETRRPYPVSLILASLNKIGFTPVTKRSTKTQALEAIKLLCSSNTLQLERAPMLLRATITTRYVAEFKEGLAQGTKAKILRTLGDDATETIVDFLLPPDQYRSVDSLVTEGGDDCSLQLLSAAVVEEGEGKFDIETYKIDPAASSCQASVISEESTQLSEPSRKAKLAVRRTQQMERSSQREESGSDDDVGKHRGKKGKGKKKYLALEETLEEARKDASENKTPEKGKGRKKRNEAAQQARLERRRQEKEKEKEKEKEEEEEDFNNKRKLTKLETKRREEERARQLLKEDPNYYSSSEAGSDYNDFYNQDDDLDADEIHAQKQKQREDEEKKRKEEEEAEAARRQRKETRQTAARKKKKRNKKGERIDTSEEED